MPRSKLSLINTLTVGRLEIFLRHTYFGTVNDPNTADVNGNGIIESATINGQLIAVEHPKYDGRTITDFSLGYDFNKKFRLTIGANNVFDLYPDKNLKTQVLNNNSVVDLSNNNQFEFSRNVSQFGFNGRFIFARLNLSL